MSPMTKPRPPGRFAWVRQAVATVPEPWLEYIEPGRQAAAS